jgi:muramidase (phage lysozyme)
MNKQALIDALDNRNVAAFLKVIRSHETTLTDDAYRMVFGGALFSAPPWKHPEKVLVRKLRGREIPSSAAGAYQFLRGTWWEMQRLYNLEDFSPENQDIAAVGLIVRRGALHDVMEGRFHAAIRRCAKEWASLPGSPYDQPTQSFAQALATYTEHGGRINEEVRNA